jgi:ribosomal-protein-alanine N-acetyltransferase
VIVLGRRAATPYADAVNADVAIRPAVRSDAADVAALFAAQREHLAPWDPRREPAFFTRGGQRARLAQVERDRAAGTAHRFLILERGELAGEISITNVVRRAFQSANLGYWVAKERNGRGVATAAVAQVCAFAFGELELHRLEAGTLLHNVASQVVLDRNGFAPFGVARNYLRIAGSWCDHVLFQRTSEQPVTPMGTAALARTISALADPQ